MRQARLVEPGTSYYHCMSRVVDKRHIFGREEMSCFRDVMRGLEQAMGVQVVTHCLMSNHFHLLLRVPDEGELMPADAVSDAQLVAMVRPLLGAKAAQNLAAELANCDQWGFAAKKQQIRDGFLRRRGRLDLFMKDLKQRFTQWFNRREGRRGTLWEDRFKSVLVGDSEQALLAMAAYIDLNPVRAGMVEDPADYIWSGYGEACAGSAEARRGLSRVLDPEGKRARRPDWRQTAVEYRKLLYGVGEEKGLREDGSPVRQGFSRQQVLREIRNGGRLPLWQALRCRMRYFSDGGVFGSGDFVEQAFERHRDRYGTRRKTGARQMRGAQWGELRVLRDLQIEVFG
jgi:REP element-mobilizing transposase RayT